jgi:hypothetical protein
MVYKLKPTLGQPTDQLQHNKYELLNEIRKYFPIRNGVTVDLNTNVNFGNESVKNVGLSTDLFDGLTHGYLMGVATEFMAWAYDGANQEMVFVSARAAATGNVALSGSLPLVVDGVTFDATSVMLCEPSQGYVDAFGPYATENQLKRMEMTKHMILLSKQTNPKENGLYVFRPSGGSYTLQREYHTRTGTGLGRGTLFSVDGEGTVNGGTLWMVHECIADNWPLWPIPSPTPVDPFIDGTTATGGPLPQSIKFTRLTLKKSASTIADLTLSETLAQTAAKVNEYLGILKHISVQTIMV